ncbi:hypothetical protein FA95DRAFT_1184015 [Auriscalpium vulgare]|uniref:Uncharacterized protein n=1 Tax=Auriscalpium vulgare TaxID=40419 RepID=A0ACB8RVJ4_9AGAM|nr:hypothetical protein FA95DRAFT_1184015 [Auriscalpium vulgare]
MGVPAFCSLQKNKLFRALGMKSPRNIGSLSVDVNERTSMSRRRGRTGMMPQSWTLQCYCPLDASINGRVQIEALVPTKPRDRTHSLATMVDRKTLEEGARVHACVGDGVEREEPTRLLSLSHSHGHVTIPGLEEPRGSSLRRLAAAHHRGHGTDHDLVARIASVLQSSVLQSTPPAVGYRTSSHRP